MCVHLSIYVHSNITCARRKIDRNQRINSRARGRQVTIYVPDFFSFYFSLDKSLFIRTQIRHGVRIDGRVFYLFI
jgi:hypothetical protein